jgi:hypothetical protein
MVCSKLGNIRIAISETVKTDGKSVLPIKYEFSLCLQILFQTYVANILESYAGGARRNAIRHSCDMPLLSDFKQNWNVTTNFIKSEIYSSVLELSHMDRRTIGRT